MELLQGDIASIMIDSTQMAGSRLERPGNPKRVVLVNWERLVEDPVWEVFNSHLLMNFSHIPPQGGWGHAIRRGVWVMGVRETGGRSHERWCVMDAPKRVGRAVPLPNTII